MERVYVDMNQVDGACVGVFVSGKEVVPVGTTVYSMSVEDRDMQMSMTFILSLMTGW